MSVLVGVAITCILVGIIIGYVICALTTPSVESCEQLQPQTEEALHGSPHSLFDQKI